ncbi:amino acid transporter [Athelia psychrophila]|uniref:Amino acid transporter n=1 Tax=Athelia psychrophila TaxID=1759441 RepID=A0A166MCN8_9AGAM|nr:amino acid transporter [Fibularhizoctonia sp. CBS 109695]
MLSVGQLLGAGMYSVPGSVLSSVGSIGLFLLYWVLGPLIAYCGLHIYVEFASLFPNRSGAEVVYLEQAYPRPRYFIPTVFAFSTVLLSYVHSRFVVHRRYFLTICNAPVTPYNQIVTALGCLTLVALALGLSTKWSLRLLNLLTFMKILSTVFMVGLGIAVLAGITRVEDPYANFRGIFNGSNSNPNSLATAFVKINYTFVGWHNAFNVIGEVKSANPVRTIRKASFISLALASFLFFFVNLAYVAAIPREELRDSGQLVAALFFRRVLGDTWAAKLLPAMVTLSCFGSLFMGNARVIREIARQGLLPYSSLFASTKPFGTPLGPLLLKWGTLVVAVLAVPSKDAFNFMADLASYPTLIFQVALVVGLLLVRKRNALEGASPSKYQAPSTFIGIFLASSVLLLVLPWLPPDHGRGDVSFWHATYCVAALIILAMCALYYYSWLVWLPRLGGYTVVEEIAELDGGARATRLRRRYAKSPERQALLGSSSLSGL